LPVVHILGWIKGNLIYESIIKITFISLPDFPANTVLLMKALL